MTLKLRENIQSHNGNCVVNERKAIADVEAIHSTLLFENFFHALLLLALLELIAILIFVVFKCYHNRQTKKNRIYYRLFKFMRIY